MSDDVNGSQPRPIDDNQSQNEADAPQFIDSRPGRMVSRRGLVERVVEEFMLEHGEAESDALRDVRSDVERRQLLRDVAEYIFAVESMRLSPHEQAQIIKAAYAEIFGYGPLDAYLQDPDITTITLEGTQHISVRRGVGHDLENIDPIFETLGHMRQMIERLVRHADAELREDISIVEAGLKIKDRRVSLSVAAPPLVPEMAADIRLHPLTSPTLDDWQSAGILNKKTRTLLEAIIQSPHGMLIVGDTESGKTTLLNMLLATLSGAGMATVERTGELALPDKAQQFVVQWAVDDREGVSFGEQIQNVLSSDTTPQLIVLDEVRADEPAMIAPLLTQEDAPRQIWSFRGTADSKRLQSSLGMLARMADASQSEFMVSQLHRRLPFIVSIKRRRGKLQVREIAEWQFLDDAPTYASYIPLIEFGDVLTGKMPKNKLDLPDDFWSQETD